MIIKNEKIERYKSKLKQIRVSRGMTQIALSDLSGVNLKSIASYEQYPERINRASVETVLKLSDSLGCNFEDIIYL